MVLRIINQVTVFMSIPEVFIHEFVQVTKHLMFFHVMTINDGVEVREVSVVSVV